MGVMLVKQVRKRDTRNHVSHSQPFISLDCFGKRKGQGKKNQYPEYLSLLLTQGKTYRDYTVLRLCIHSAPLTHIVLACYFVSVFLSILVFSKTFNYRSVTQDELRLIDLSNQRVAKKLSLTKARVLGTPS